MNRHELLKLAQSYECVGTIYHILKTGFIPSKKRISDVNKEKWEDFLNYVKDTYEYKKEDYFQIDHLLPNGEISVKIFLHLENNITLYNPYDDDEAELIFDSSSDTETLQDLEQRFQRLIPKKEAQSIGLIRYRQGRLEVKFFDYKLPEHSLIPYLDQPTKTFYNEMIQNLNAEEGSGLYLLYGRPGTGKTSFIKEVLSKIPKENLFISPSYTQDLTSPELVSLLMEHPNSVLVIEDAETVIMEREADNSSAVSNLLNLTDGFLADFLNLNIICTFNTRLDNIDAALLRGGRLKGTHKFEKIKPENAQRIASLLGRKMHVEKPMTLAEICNTKSQRQKIAANGIGFR